MSNVFEMSTFDADYGAVREGLKAQDMDLYYYVVIVLDGGVCVSEILPYLILTGSKIINPYEAISGNRDFSVGTVINYDSAEYTIVGRCGGTEDIFVHPESVSAAKVEKVVYFSARLWNCRAIVEDIGKGFENASVKLPEKPDVADLFSATPFTLEMVALLAMCIFQTVLISVHLAGKVQKPRRVMHLLGGKEEVVSELYLMVLITMLIVVVLVGNGLYLIMESYLYGIDNGLEAYKLSFKQIITADLLYMAVFVLFSLPVANAMRIGNTKKKRWLN